MRLHQVCSRTCTLWQGRCQGDGVGLASKKRRGECAWSSGLKAASPGDNDEKFSALHEVKLQRPWQIQPSLIACPKHPFGSRCDRAKLFKHFDGPKLSLSFIRGLVHVICQQVEKFARLIACTVSLTFTTHLPNIASRVCGCRNSTARRSHAKAKPHFVKMVARDCSSNAG